MEDPEEEWETQESEENSDQASWILDKGLTLGKRILVTGIVISSAPLVLPTLAVVSAIGFACSVPYGLFLASYACTEKVMSKLLPTPTPSPLPVEYGTKDNEEVEGKNAVFGGNIDLENEDEEMRVQSLQSKIEEETEVLIGEEYVHRGVEKDEKKLAEDGDEIVEKNGYEEDVGEYTGGEEEGKSLIRDELQNERTGEVEEEAAAKESRGTVHEISGMVIQIEGDESSGKVEVTNLVAVSRQGHDSKETQPSEDINIREEQQRPDVIKADMFPEGRPLDNSAKDAKQDYEMKRERDIVISSNSDSREIADESGFDLFDDKNAAGPQYSYKDSKGSEQPSYTVKAADTPELAVPPRVDEFEGARISSEKDTDMTSNSVVFGEEKIWKQIDAMRTIVGYKAAPCTTYIEELKALYLFTGVEPPTSFKNPSDLDEVNDKLRFLMCVVGVK